ncbi:MAG TPA: HAD family hydrolase [Thermoplasmata archaeon]
MTPLTPPRPVRGVLFDLGGTLIDERAFDRMVEFAGVAGLDLDEGHLAHAYAEVERESDGPQRWSVEQFWGAVLDRAAGRPTPALVVQRFFEQTRRWSPVPRLYSDTMRCLTQLREEGRTMGVVSNSRSEESVRGMLRATAIHDFFRVVVSSGTEGIAKPDPEIFRRAVARLGVPVEECFYVGNLAFTDAKAAQSAGLRSAWLHRDGWGFGDDPPEITSLTELPFYLWELEGRSPERSR